MGQFFNPSVPKNLVFCFDALNPKCYSGTGTSFTELVSGTTATAVATTSLGMDSSLGSPHLKFTPGETTRTAYIPFPVDVYGNNGVVVPTGTNGTWSWWQYFQDQGNIDHPNIGWETSNAWDGQNGFVFGTGYGTDGPRWGIGGTAYTVYSTANPDYQPNIWQNWTVTYDGNISNGLKTYLNGSLIDERSAGNTIISGDNSNNLHIGSTNARGGNWGGYMDLIHMWSTTLSAGEVSKHYEMFKGRF